MKLGISINLFDGQELLEDCIMSARLWCDFVHVCVQLTSNNGKHILPLPDNLSLADAVTIYTPIGGRLHQNELAKRNLGMRVCRDEGCTHFASMDVDEFYHDDEVWRLKVQIEREKIAATYCRMYTYYKRKDYRLKEIEGYYVPFIMDLSQCSALDMKANAPVLVDPTRRPITSGSFLLAAPFMHHYSYVRDDIRLKLQCSSASTNWANHIERIASYWENWQKGQPALWPGRVPILLELVKFTDGVL